MKNIFAVAFIVVAITGCANLKLKQAAVTAGPEGTQASAEGVITAGDAVADVTITTTPGGEVEAAVSLDVIPPAHFAFDSAALQTDDMLRLFGIAEALKRYEHFTISVEGHCDSRGTEQYNTALGLRRAESVRDYLEVLGVDRARIGVVSYGETRSLCPDETEPCWAKNRRASIIVKVQS